jgi:hypothetical protein
VHGGNAAGHHERSDYRAQCASNVALDEMTIAFRERIDKHVVSQHLCLPDEAGTTLVLSTTALYATFGMNIYAAGTRRT